MRIWKGILRAKSALAILLLLAVSVGSVARTINADSPVHVSVSSTPGAHVSITPTPVPGGKSFTVAFWFEAGCCQWTGHETAKVNIWQSTPTNSFNAKIWQSTSMKVAPGLHYEVNPPGISTSGTYAVLVDVLEPDGKPVATGYASFQVVQVAGWSATTTAAATPFDFSLRLSPSSITVKQGETATFQILISYSAPSYSGTSINAQISGLGPGMNYQLIPSPPTLRVSTSSSTSPGSYPITLTGSAKGVKHQANAILVVKAVQPFDFSISVSPAQRTITPGGSTNSTVTVALLSGPSKSVTLTVSGAPDGVSASLSPTSGTPRFKSILSITTIPSVAPGQYPLTITGTAGTTSHPATFMLTIGQSPDFRIDVNPPSQTSTQGGTTTYQISVVSLNGFNSQVTLSVSGLPSGGVFTITSGTPNFDSALTVTLPANAPTGSFTLTVTGTGGGLNKAANLILNINPTTQTSTQTSTQTPSPPGGDLMNMLQQNQLLILAAVILLVGAAFVGSSRHRKPSGPTQGAPKTGVSYCRTPRWQLSPFVVV